MLRAIGLNGAGIDGETLLARLSFMSDLDLVDTLRGLVLVGYVVADRDRFQTTEEIKALNFAVNSAYSRDLREIISGRKKDRERRRRRR